MKKILIATKNVGKLREMTAALSELPVKVLSLTDFENLPDAVENGKTFEDNAKIKAKFFHKLTGLACIADDSGLEVDALNGAPGVNSARYAGYHADDGTNNTVLLNELKKIGVEESPADYRCALCFVDNDVEILTEGKVDGTIKISPRGNGGFGYDPYFYLSNGKTMAELTPTEKDSISHRGEALRKIIPMLRKLFPK
ncbi:MAG: RdgB/HAM1 family non-canonical purine NTP pyrophosphatase [Selenomonadaceae bacterium]|nr:RdgB/HAM1 family non-canonical purine NTP pyrophosphatase [Selenomonadaceae bacterium]